MSLMTRPVDGTGPPPPRGPRMPFRRPGPVAVALLVALGIVLVFIAVSWTHAPWRDYVRRKPPTYVELTVVRPEALPSTFVAGKPVRFAFSVKNAGQAGTKRTVSWVTSVRDTVTGSSDSVNRGSAVIAAGDTKTVSEQVTIQGAHRSEVIVKLGTGEQIDFYLTPPAAPASG